MTSSTVHQQCFSFNASIDQIEQCVMETHLILVILRGAPGSGKSTLARELLCQSDNSVIFTDEQEIFENVDSSMKNKTSLVIVDDDNIERTKIKKLVNIAVSNKYEFFIVEPNTSWKYDEEECKKKTSKNMDISAIKMKIKLMKLSVINWKSLIGGEDQVKIENLHVRPKINIEEELEALKRQRDQFQFLEDSDYSSEDTSEDEIYALCQQADFDVEFDTGFYGSEEKKKILELTEIFGSTRIDIIRGAFDAAAKDLEIAKSFLLGEGHSVEERRRTSPKKTRKEGVNQFLNNDDIGRNHSCLESAQRRAVERYLEDPLPSSAIREIDEDIRSANSNPHFLDLHFMSVKSAVRLVEEAIEAVRYLKRTQTKSHSWITVITGAGVHSKDGPKIKPRIIEMLSKSNIIYKSLSDGCIQLKIR